MAIITSTSSSASTPQGSPRFDEPTKNEALALKVLQALEKSRPQLTEGFTDDWSLDGWDEEPFSPETTKKYEAIFAKNAAKLEKANASRNEYTIFG